MRADRLISLLLLLQAHGRMPAPDLARRLEVSVRTVFRDMDALSTAGFPVYAERGRAGGCALLPGFRTDVSGLTAAEAQALLLLSGGVSGVAEDLGLSATARSALRKLTAGLPAAIRPDADLLARHVLVDHHGWHRPPHLDDPERWLGPLRGAVLAGKRVRLVYESASGTGARLVDPWGLVAKAGIWYLVGTHRGQRRMYRVCRVRKATVLDEPADRPADLDLAAVWAEMRDEFERPRTDAERVTLRVRTPVLPMLQRMVAPQLATDDAAIEPADAGWFRMEATFRSRGAARGTLLGFAADVEVLAPEALRTEMRVAAEAVARLYAPALTATPPPGQALAS